MGGNSDFSTDDTTGTNDLVALIRKQMDAANVHLTALREAISAAILKAVIAQEEQKRIAKLKADLDAAWKKAGRIIDRLEQLSGQPERRARAALSESRASARETFDQLWMLVTTHNGRK